MQSLRWIRDARKLSEEVDMQERTKIVYNMLYTVMR